MIFLVKLAYKLSGTHNIFFSFGTLFLKNNPKRNLKRNFKKALANLDSSGPFQYELIPHMS